MRLPEAQSFLLIFGFCGWWPRGRLLENLAKKEMENASKQQKNLHNYDMMNII